MAEQKSTLIIEVNAQNAQNNVHRLEIELRNLTNQGERTVRQTDQMGGAFQKLAGMMAGVLTVSTAISKMDTYTNLQNRLKLVTQNQEELNKSLKDTFAIAQETAQSWETVTMVYQRFSDNAKKLNLTMGDTASLTNTVSKAIAVSGSSATSAEAALMQFGQALSSNILRGEEFNSIAEQAPALLKAIASGLDVDIGKLRAMAKDGKLTGEVVVGALENAKESVDGLFAKTDFSIANGFTQLNNAVIEFVGESGKANGAATFLASSLKTLSENLGAIANVAVLGGVALLTKAIISQTMAVKGGISSMVARRAATLAELQSQVQLAAVEVQRTRQVTALAMTEINLARQELNSATTRSARTAATMRLTQAEIAHALAVNQGTKALASQTVAQEANTAARSRGAMVMGALGGVTGLLTIGVTALAAGYMYLKSKSDEVNDSYSTQITKVSDLAQQYRELNTAKLVNEQELVNQKLKDFQSDAIGAEASIKTLAGAMQRAVGEQKTRQDFMASIAADLRSESITTGQALKKMVDSGLFTDEHYAKANKYFAEFNTAKSGVNEMNKQLGFISEQTGIFGDKSDETSKKLASQKVIVNALSESYEIESKNLQNSINWLLQQESSLKSSETAHKAVNKAIADYNSGTITATQLAQELRKQLPVEGSTLDSIDKLASKTTGAKDELEKARKEADKIPQSANNAKSGFDLIGESATNAKADVAGLSAELELINKLNKDTGVKKYEKALVDSGKFSLENAKAYADFYERNSRNPNKDEALIIIANVKANKDLQSSINAVNDSQRERTKLIKEQNKESKEGVKLSALVLQNAKKYNFAEKEQRYNLPSGIISAIQQRESGGNTYNSKGGLLTSKAGAQGSSQFMPATAKRFNVDVRSVDSSAEGTAKYLRYLLDKFNGDLDKAIMSYNAGEGNVQSGKAYSFKETQNYLKDVKKNMGASEYASQWESAQKDIAQKQKEYQEKQEEIDYKYSNAKAQREADLQRELLYLRQNGREDEAKQAQRFYDENEKLITMQNVYSLNEHKLTEKQKLDATYRINEQSVIANREMALQEKKDAIIKLQEVFTQQDAILQASVKLRQSQYEKLYMTEAQLIEQNYKDQVIDAMNIADIDLRNHELRMAQAQRELSTQDQLNRAKADWKTHDPSAIDTPYQTIDDEEVASKQSAINLLDAEVAELERQNELTQMADFNEQMAQIQQDGADRITDIERRAAEERMNLNVTSAQGIAGSLADMFKTMQGDQSKAYKVMFATEKAFNIAKTMMAIPTAIAQAASLPFPANLGAVATVVSLTGSLVSDISAISNLGFKSGGYTGNVGTSSVAGVVHGQEYVLNASATKRVGVDTLNAINSGGSLGGGSAVNIVINPPQGYTATTNQEGDTVTIDVVKQMIDQSWDNAKKPNSNESRAMQSAFALSPNR